MSITVPLEGFGGGGGAALNFKVVGNPQPANPKENTVWVDTDTPITSWIFIATEPEAAEGMVWFSTGTSSPAEFNALKKNGIAVYPLFAKQYVSGAWVSKDAKCYQNGAWSEIGKYLYNYGYTDDAWITAAKIIEPNTSGLRAPTVSIDGNGVMTITQTGTNSGGICYYPAKVDLTPYKTLTFSGKLYESSGNTPLRAAFIAWSSFGSYFLENNAVRTQSPVDGTVSLDVSALSGEYYIGFGLYHTNSYAKVNYIKLQ